MKGSELAGVIIFQSIWVGFWFLVGVNFIAGLGVVALVFTLFGIAFSNG
jgi:uncharacterized membrane protein YccC